jgi:hypothetical protein
MRGMTGVRMAVLVVAAAAAGPLVAQEAIPALRDGDLVFQSSTAGQSGAVLAATGHPFTHMGIVKIRGGEALVVEAWSEVMVTPLAEWVARDARGRVAIYRDPDLTAAEGAAVVAAAEAYAGRPYDIFFRFGDEAIYCSELAWLAYDAIGLQIGQVEELGDLNVSDARVQELINQRWTFDPVCAAEADGFADCLALLRKRELVTPASIAGDVRFAVIYSSFVQ